MDATTTHLPRVGFDSTLALLREGYDFIGARCDALGTDGFRTRIMLRDVVCLRGAAAVELLYRPDGLTRRNALPAWVLHLLQDRGSVQQMEGEAHHARKAMFLRLVLDSDADRILAERFGQLWETRAAGDGDFEVLGDASRFLAQAALEWCGFGPSFARDPALAEALFEMSDRTGRPGPRAWAALLRRRAVERRLAKEVRARRKAGFAASDLHLPLARLSLVEEQGALLPAGVVAVELLNLLRPIVAVGRFIAFAARLLILHPQWRQRFSDGADALIAPFCEEVRRISPFFPFTAAICTQPQLWNGVRLRPGQWVIADLFGTCRDPALFPNPLGFEPGRRLDWRVPAPGFVPQGAGDLATTHRCPGEKVTVRLMAKAVTLLCRGRAWEPPPQDLSVATARMPARPADGVVIRFR